MCKVDLVNKIEALSNKSCIAVPSTNSAPRFKEVSQSIEKGFLCDLVASYNSSKIKIKMNLRGRKTFELLCILTFLSLVFKLGAAW